jgi:hypothetical protein
VETRIFAEHRMREPGDQLLWSMAKRQMQVEGAPAFEIEASVVPMTGQDAIFDGAAVEWNTHVRTTVIEGEDAPLVVDDKDGTVAAVHDKPPFRLEFFKAIRERKFLVCHVHEHTSRIHFWGLP